MTKGIKTELLKFLIKDYSISEFENIVYENESWEKNIRKETYMELLVFDYKQLNAYERLSKFILKNLIEDIEFKRNKIQKYFRNCGWYKNRDTKIEFLNKYHSPAYHYAIKILTEFGDLNLEESPSIKTNIYFNKTPIKFHPWSSEIDPLFFIAEFNRSYSILLVNNQKDFFAYHDTIDEIYHIGNGFENTIISLIEGQDSNEDIYNTKVNKNYS